MINPIADNDILILDQTAACGYEARQRIGEGAYGFVYEVGDNSGNLFAFKYVLPDAKYETRGLDNLTEIDILSRVYHPHIIHASKIINSNNCEIIGLALVLPLADRTLYDVTYDRNLTTENKLPILYELSTALQFMHRSNILHLDIKSANVVIQGMKENIPYFIDFGLSMIVDDVITGKYSDQIRVTVDYRPPEILAGGRIYNSAVDTWSFGVMALYAIICREIFNVDFDTITDLEFRQVIIDMFSTPDAIMELLLGIRDEYYDLCVDFFTKILRINPDERLTAEQIRNHPLFDEFRGNKLIHGSLDVPLISYDYADDHRDILKLIIHWAETLYPNSPIELLFLAIDLFNRVDSFYKDYEAIDRMTLSATCLWMASKLTNETLIPLNIYVPKLVEMIEGITANNILQIEINIIYLLSGVLHVSELYKSCRNGDELKLTFDHVIMSRDSTLYARTDIPEWVKLMRSIVTIPRSLSKNIEIIDFLS